MTEEAPTRECRNVSPFKVHQEVSDRLRVVSSIGAKLVRRMRAREAKRVRTAPWSESEATTREKYGYSDLSEKSGRVAEGDITGIAASERGCQQMKGGSENKRGRRRTDIPARKSMRVRKARAKEGGGRARENLRM